MLEKKQKLFLEEPDAEGFQAYRLEERPGENLPPEQKSVSAEHAFVLPEHFWQWFESDELVRREMARRIEEKSLVAAEARFAELHASVEKKAYEEGIQRGIEEAKQRLVQIQDELTRICTEVTAEKRKLLIEHEAEWGRALGQLLKQFLVPKPELTLEQIANWANEGLAAFEKAGKVRIRLSSEDYKRLHEGNVKAGNTWELVEDQVLSPGQIQCDCDSGGFFFSPSEQWEKLNQWIERFTGRK